jgi:hypothetical protein
MFGDEPRFHKSMVQNSKGIQGFRNHETDEHVGPGSYFAAQNEESRGGWSSKSFSKRQPMSPESRPVDRSFHYTSGVIVPTGLALPGSPLNRSTPGPGYYGRPITAVRSSPFFEKLKFAWPLQEGKRSRPNSADAGLRTSYMGTSQRLAAPSAVIKDGVLFSSISQNVGVGPGHYSTPDNLVKKSFNTRAGSGRTPKKSASSAPSSPGFSPRNSASVRSSRTDLQDRLREQNS